jgi:hypothetical protein
LSVVAKTLGWGSRNGWAVVHHPSLGAKGHNMAKVKGAKRRAGKVSREVLSPLGHNRCQSQAHRRDHY